jgi:hypothetical protein
MAEADTTSTLETRLEARMDRLESALRADLRLWAGLIMAVIVAAGVLNRLWHSGGDDGDDRGAAGGVYRHAGAEEVPMRPWTRGLRGPRASQLAWGALAAALVLGVVGMLAVPAATMEERVARLEGIIGQIDERLHTLEWMVGLSIAWTTLLIGSAVGLWLKYR